MMSAETQQTDPDNKKIAASRVESWRCLKEVIFEQQIKLWSVCGAELEFVCAYLVEELVFYGRTQLSGILFPVVYVREINRIFRREEETIQLLF